MAGMNPVRWAASGIKELPSNAAWLASRALRSAGSLSTDSETGESPMRKIVDRAAAPLAHGSSIEVRLRRAEAAVASAKDAEQRALAEAQAASDRAAAARANHDDNEQRLRDARRAGREEVGRRTRDARERLAQLVDNEQDQAEREVGDRLDQLTADLQRESERVRNEAAVSADRARESIDAAHRQMIEARRLADEATTAAQEASAQAHAQARAVAEEAEDRTGPTDAAVTRAAKTTSAVAATAARAATAESKREIPGRLADQTKDELLQLATPLGVNGARKMTKDQLVRAIRSAARTTSKTR